MAEALTSYHVAYGDWRKMFTGIDDIARVSADDVQRVARQYLTPETRTVAYTIAPSGAGSRPANASEGGAK
jgi:zinc protease